MRTAINFANSRLAINIALRELCHPLGSYVQGSVHQEMKLLTNISFWSSLMVAQKHLSPVATDRSDEHFAQACRCEAVRDISLGLQEQSRGISTSDGSLASAPDSQSSGRQYQHQDSFDFIAGSMRKCLNHLGPWSIGDLAFGL
jgi:hypothetical protein